MADGRGAQIGEVLKFGARGVAVAKLQEQLNALGYPLRVDGIFGAETRKAVERFQRAMGLKADGIVGPQTQRAIAQQLVAQRQEHRQSAPLVSMLTNLSTPVIVGLAVLLVWFMGSGGKHAS